jgi:hypothetical protein
MAWVLTARVLTTFVGRADGVEISVGVRPEPGAGHSVVLLHLGAPGQETAAGVRLEPDEADRLSAALSAAAFTAAGSIPGGSAPAAPTTAGHTRPEPEPEPDPGLTEITAVEGTAAAELSAAIAQLPYLEEWPDLSPLAVNDRVRGTVRFVEAGPYDSRDETEGVALVNI